MMLALTLWRPWSDALIRGPKMIENRGWWPKGGIGKTYAIHGGKRWDEDGARSMRMLWTPPSRDASPEGIVGVARLVGVIAPGPGDDGDECPIVIAGLPGVHVDADASWWSGHSYGWVFDQRVAIEPVPCRGAQGLWALPAPVESIVRERVAAARAA